MANLLSWLGDTAKNVEKNVGNFVGGAVKGAEQAVTHPDFNGAVGAVARQFIPGLQQVNQVKQQAQQGLKSPMVQIAMKNPNIPSFAKSYINYAQNVANKPVDYGNIVNTAGGIVTRPIAQAVPQLNPVGHFLNQNIIQPQLTTMTRVTSAGQGAKPYATGWKGAGQVAQDATNLATDVLPGASQEAALLTRLGVNALPGAATSIGSDLASGNRNVGNIAKDALLSAAATAVLGEGARGLGKVVSNFHAPTAQATEQLAGKVSVKPTDSTHIQLPGGKLAGSTPNPIVKGADIKSTGGTQRVINQSELDHYTKTGNLPANADGYTNLAKPGQLNDVKGIPSDKQYLVTFRDGLPIDSQAGPQIAIKGQIGRQHVAQIEPYVPPTTAESLMQAEKAAQPKRSWIPDEGGYVGLPGKKDSVIPDSTLTKESRFANETVQKSPEVGDALKAAVKDKNVQYTAQTEEAGLKTAAKEIGAKTKGTKVNDLYTHVLTAPAGTISRQEAISAQVLAKNLQESGTAANMAKASDILGKLSEHYTASGQLTQAAALLAKDTPQGMLYSATKALKNAGVTVEGKLQTDLNAAIDAVKAAKPGTNERDFAYQKLANLVNTNIPRSKAQAAVGIWRAGLLTGPETVAKVATSYAINTPGELLSNIPAAAADKVASLFTGKRTLGLTARGIGSGVKEGASAAKTHLLTGLDVPNTGGFTHGIGEAAHQTAYEQGVLRVHGTVFKVPYKIGYNNSLASQATASAANQGLKGAERSAFIKDFISKPSQVAQDVATKDAKFIANLQDTALGEGAGKLAQWKVAGIPVGKIIAPFTKIPSAIGTKGLVDFTPLGLGKATNTLIKGIRNGNFDQRLFSQEIGRGTVGTGTAAIGAALMGAGLMTLKAPTDPKERALWDAQGKTPNSIQINGKWVSLNTFGAAGITLGLGGAFNNALKDGGDPGHAASQAALAAGGLLADQPYFKGISGAANALSDPNRYANSFINSTVGSVVPAAVQQAARGSDTVQRAYPSKLADKLKSEIPGLRQSLPVQNDLYGQPEPGSNPNGSVGGAILGTVNPFYPSAPRNQSDPVTQELQRLYTTGGSTASPNIGPPSKSMTINGQKTKLTDQQLSDFIGGSGPLVHSGIQNLINNPVYAGLSDGEKSNEISKVITAARQAQEITQLGNNPKSQTNQTKTALSDPNNLGTTISSSSSGADPSSKYQSALQKYNNDIKQGSISDVNLASRQSALTKLKAESGYSQDTVDLYGQSYKNIVSFVNSNKNGAALWDQVKALDKSMTDAGYASKLYNKNGSLKATVAKSGGAKKGKVVKLPKFHISGKSTYAVKKITSPKVAKLPVSKLPKIKINKMIA